MGLETGTYPSDFVLTNPTAGDPKAQGDDHLRLIKACVQNALPIGAPNYPLTSGTAQSASGTSVDFTDIPSWVTRVTVIFSGVSTNGSSNPLIQLGDSGGVEATTYTASSIGSASPNTVAGAAFTTGFGLYSTSAAAGISGHMTITKISGVAWVASGAFAYTGSAASIVSGGSKSLSGTLDRVRITTVNGTDSYDGGTINILYE